MRLCLLGSYSCAPGGKLGSLKGQIISILISAEVTAVSTWDQQDVLGAGTCLLAHLAWGHTNLWWFGRIRAGHYVPDFQCSLLLWDSNSWTALRQPTFLQKKLHWSQHTNWRLETKCFKCQSYSSVVDAVQVSQASVRYCAKLQHTNSCVWCLLLNMLSAEQTKRQSAEVRWCGKVHMSQLRARTTVVLYRLLSCRNCDLLVMYTIPLSVASMRCVYIFCMLHF